MIATILFSPKVIKAQLASGQGRFNRRGRRGADRLDLRIRGAVVESPEVEFALGW
ncbi:hypothetical protein [Cryobacterium frigoriphilum]|uniref:hypothetical protein n=1 Tax=Cryobacterium frigoriphilum TaxID=1259150 RepID=UPI00141A8E1D|nr:hypothetical protein [Cryobacterium frigoriphilum]